MTLREDIDRLKRTCRMIGEAYDLPIEVVRLEDLGLIIEQLLNRIEVLDLAQDEIVKVHDSNVDDIQHGRTDELRKIDP